MSHANLNLITAAPGLFEELGKVTCAECQHPLRLHIAGYGCEHELGDRDGNEGEPMQAMGPCGCRGDEFSQKAIPELGKAGDKPIRVAIYARVSTHHGQDPELRVIKLRARHNADDLPLFTLLESH